MARQTALPDTLPPRLIDRPAAAAFLGVGTTKFDAMVEDGRAPRPKRIDGRKLWDVKELHAAADSLPYDEPAPEREIVL
jgi:predicted DNA-binding transcriptional regulator AlpA